MSCKCKNNEYHPCQHGGECQCGGKCKNDDSYLNIVGNIDVFKDEKGSRKKLVGYIIGGFVLAIVSIFLIRKLI